MSGLVCRGAYVLGTACGDCSRCEEEEQEMRARGEWPPGPPFDEKPKVWSARAGAPMPPEGAVLIDRNTKWGNPFVLEHEKDRAKILKMYETWLLSQPEKVEEAKRELKGKHLVCWCAPKPCHGDVLLRIANEE